MDSISNGEPRNLVHLLASVEPLLRRLRRTDPVQQALDDLKRLLDPNGPWSASEEVEIRIACLRVVQEYVDSSIGRSGSAPIHDLFEVQRVLPSLRQRIQGDVRAVERIGALAANAGVELDPSKPGGGLVRTGRRGAPPTVLRECVKDLLRERFPEWDPAEDFPEENSEELRTWVSSSLTRTPTLDEDWTSGTSWQETMDAYPFRPEDIDPRNRGPLWSIINTLKNAHRQ